MANFNDYRKIVKLFKNAIRLDFPISIKRCNLPDDLDGTCSFNGKRFVIKIKKTLPEYYAIDVVIHEIAHAMAWDKEKDVHGVMWGKAYSKVYRLFLKEWIEKL